MDQSLAPETNSHARVVDVDGHVIEPWDLWFNCFPDRLKHAAPRKVQDSMGVPRLMVESRLFPTPEGPGRAPGRILSEEQQQIYRQHIAAGSDPHLRVPIMDEMGIDVSILLPSQGLVAGSVRDTELASAICATYNNWLANYCRPYEKRLAGVALVPLMDIDAAVAETRRCIEELGFIAVYARPNPIMGRNLLDPYYDPFYGELTKLKVNLLVHEGCGFAPDATVGVDRFENGFFSHVISHPFEQMLACLSIIAGGVLERFPELRVGFMEAGSGWLPYWLERMDEHYEQLQWEVPWLTKLPSEYFRDQCFVTCEADEPGLRLFIETIGLQCLTYASDFPHSDQLGKDTVGGIQKREDLSDAEKGAILGGNAVRLFGL
jgi:uncharacterized protein